MAKRVIAIQIDLQLEEGQDYQELLDTLKNDIDMCEGFDCMSIGYVDDLTETYKQYN